MTTPERHAEVCPKCGEPFLGKSCFGEPDQDGIIGMVYHRIKKVTNALGFYVELPTDRCFLTNDEWEKINPNRYHAGRAK
jgi:hypothetical protein